MMRDLLQKNNVQQMKSWQSHSLKVKMKKKRVRRVRNAVPKSRKQWYSMLRSLQPKKSKQQLNSWLRNLKKSKRKKKNLDARK